jgi:hypothetical protein
VQGRECRGAEADSVDRMQTGQERGCRLRPAAQHPDQPGRVAQGLGHARQAERGRQTRRQNSQARLAPQNKSDVVR